MGKLSTLILVALYLLVAPLFGSHPLDSLSQHRAHPAVEQADAASPPAWRLAPRLPDSQSLVARLH